MRRLLLALILPLALSGAALSQEKAAPRILVAFHSQTGHTETLAEAVRDGAAGVEGVGVLLRPVGEVTTEEILQADGILLGTPVHWAGLSAESKAFLDQVGAAILEADEPAGRVRTAGAFCTGGAVSSGKELARLSILAAFLNMRFVLVGGVAADGFGTLGAQATTGPEDPGVSAEEKDEARAFGERFARLTLAVSDD